eukprot:6234162-Prymnesium_polylepis.2
MQHRCVGGKRADRRQADLEGAKVGGLLLLPVGVLVPAPARIRERAQPREQHLAVAVVVLHPVENGFDRANRRDAVLARVRIAVIALAEMTPQVARGDHQIRVLDVR